MKPFPLVAMCCAALSLSAVAVHARPAAPKTVQAAFQKLYDRENAAIAAKDIKTVFSLRTPDYETVRRNGERRTVSEARLSYQRTFAVARSIKGASWIQSLTLHGQTAQVKVFETGTVVVVLPNPHPRIKRDFVLKASSTSLDDWVQRGGHWLKRRSHALTSKMTFNGKPVPTRG